MAQSRVDIRSKWYPYNKIYGGFSEMKEIVSFPRKIMDFLLDMPDGNYTPIDDNNYPRARFWKYLYYDGAHPLDNALPTPAQKMSVLFNPDTPVDPPDEAKGWRLIPQMYIKPSETMGKTRLYVYIGPIMPDDDMTAQLAVMFDIWTHYTEEANSHDIEYSRGLGMSQAIIETFHGVNIDGVGGFYYDRTKNSSCGEKVSQDNNGNIRRQLVLGIEIKSTTPTNPVIPFNGIPFGNGFLG